jgi:hypothetical protein
VTPAKTVDKEYRRLGATRERVHGGVKYTFPDGARLLVPANIKPHVAESMILEVHRRYDVQPERPRLVGERVSIASAPRFDMDSLAVTPHAKQRRAEMGDQDNLTTREIVAALTCPMRVLYFEKHGSYAWVGERVAVVGHVRQGRLTIRTFLWTTNELWERNPRPEKELIDA